MTYGGKVTCCICTGDDIPDWCSLDCGHIFHVPCIEQWLENNPICPFCRVAARRRPRKVFLETKVDGDADASNDLLEQTKKELQELQDHLQQREDRLLELEGKWKRAVRRQEQLQQKLAEAREGLEKHKDDHLLEAAVSSSLRQELKTLHERQKTELVRVQRELKEEKARSGAQAQELQILKLSRNPHMPLAAIQQLMAEGGPDQSPAILALAERNKQLQEAEQQVQQLKQRAAAQDRKLASLQAQVSDLQRERDTGIAEREAAHRRELAAAEKEREVCHREQIQLEYKVSKLESELRELRGVLAAFEGHPELQQVPAASLRPVAPAAAGATEARGAGAAHTAKQVAGQQQRQQQLWWSKQEEQQLPEEEQEEWDLAQERAQQLESCCVLDSASQELAEAAEAAAAGLASAREHLQQQQQEEVEDSTVIQQEEKQQGGWSSQHQQQGYEQEHKEHQQDEVDELDEEDWDLLGEILDRGSDTAAAAEAPAAAGIHTTATVEGSRQTAAGQQPEELLQVQAGGAVHNAWTGPAAPAAAARQQCGAPAGAGTSAPSSRAWPAAAAAAGGIWAASGHGGSLVEQLRIKVQQGEAALVATAAGATGGNAPKRVLPVKLPGLTRAPTAAAAGGHGAGTGGVMGRPDATRDGRGAGAGNGGSHAGKVGAGSRTAAVAVGGVGLKAGTGNSIGGGVKNGVIGDHFSRIIDDDDSGEEDGGQGPTWRKLPRSAAGLGSTPLTAAAAAGERGRFAGPNTGSSITGVAVGGALAGNEVSRAPSFIKKGSALIDMTNAASAHGSFLRQGPDGRGGIACLPVVKEKRAAQQQLRLPNAHKKPKIG